ncbi:hypothetical protein CK203_113855 [Vitis vinifera]|uniref:Uncharacterized protein n=1 Tax=Vitis vinifera TaxID=29760 RepID=A0A438FD76_VITVI|nr:hypothetical protein CK203_113855 [Vitis vinifera]
MPCTICQSCDHVVDECPTMPAVREMLGDQANVVGQFRPNNMHLMETPIIQAGETTQIFLGNQDHLHTNHKPKPKHLNKPLSVEQAIVNLSKVMGDFVGEQKAINSQLHQKIENVESSQIKRMEGMQNDLSQKIDNIQYSISRLTNLNTVNEKGKFPSQPSQNPKGVHEVETQEGESSKLREVKAVITLRSGKSFNGKKEIKNSSEILEVLRQVKVNIPLLDMIKQVPTYAKFLKDLCTVKRGLHVTKNAFLTEQQLGLGGLKPTAITLSLADRSVKIPRGVIEDVLVQVDKFYYPVDFVVLDTDPIVKETNYVPIILGRPFLATSNAIINCIFTQKKRKDLEEVCLINTLVEEHCDKNLQESLNESLEMLKKGYLNPLMFYYHVSLEETGRDLTLFNQEDSQEAIVEDPPKLVLKPLPVDLKYAYLEENEKCPVVISSTLTIDQEDNLLGVLRKCKKAIGWQISDLKGISLWCAPTISIWRMMQNQ